MSDPNHRELWIESQELIAHLIHNLVQLPILVSCLCDSTDCPKAASACCKTCSDGLQFNVLAGVKAGRFPPLLLSLAYH